MGLLSIFQRGNRAAPSSSSSEGADPVQATRVRARHRLIGAAVLVVAGIVCFPLVFETQPRPIAVDIPIEIPKREGASPLTMPAANTAARPAAQARVPEAASAVVSQPPDDVITESKADAGREIASAPTASRPASAVPPVEAPRPSAETRTMKPSAEAARAKATLEGRDPRPASKLDVAKEAGRYVVQVGAFADASAARETRLKAERLGLKTYTQVVETSTGHRTRVRIGPFATREEADKALARAKGAGLNAVVLTL